MPQGLEKYLRTTLASIGDAVIATDGKGRIAFANPAALAILGASEAEIMNRPLEEIFVIRHEFTRAAVENPVARVLQEGLVLGLANHTVLIRPDGTEIPIDDSAAPIRGDDGAIQGAVVVFRDITARRRAEAARQLMASIVEASDDAIISKDIHGIITSWNRGAERIFGYTAAEAIGKPISMLAAPGRLDEMPRILDRIRQGERIDHYETVRRAKSGKLVTVSLTVSPVYDAGGRIVGASKIARDITEQVRFRSELAEERERLRVTLRSIGDAVISTDEVGKIVYMNPVAEELTRWNLREAAGRDLAEVFRIINETTRQTVENPTERVIREGRTVGLANHTVLIAKDGREYAIDDSAAPIRNQRGEIIGVVLIFRDITARRATEKQLHVQAAELRRANEELNQFAYVASHDLREPLRNIANFSELLVRELKLEPGSEVERSVEFILKGVRRMETLLNDLLAYAQLGSERELRPAVVHTNSIVQKSLTDLRSAIERTGAEITADPLPDVLGYEEQLTQLFVNLISNALKYRSAEPPRVHIRARREADEWVFSVCDNGIGIAPQYHQRIFGIFKRLHGQEISGSGIGLAICSKIVERHGGRIWVHSKVGSGSEFCFTLPCVSQARAATPDG